MSESPGGPKTCLLKRLPRALWVEASRTAAEINPVNHPHLEQLARTADCSDVDLTTPLY
jgi:hypothetical protein